MIKIILFILFIILIVIGFIFVSNNNSSNDPFARYNGEWKMYPVFPVSSSYVDDIVKFDSGNFYMKNEQGTWVFYGPYTIYNSNDSDFINITSVICHKYTFFDYKIIDDKISIRVKETNFNVDDVGKTWYLIPVK